MMQFDATMRAREPEKKTANCVEVKFACSHTRKRAVKRYEITIDRFAVCIFSWFYEKREISLELLFRRFPTVIGEHNDRVNLRDCYRKTIVDRSSLSLPQRKRPTKTTNTSHVKTDAHLLKF
jgi:hypothetical protein